ncbi:1,4-dihydroxy-6-naphthoate synthase [Deinococcus metalli]|uniref:1,4-dihydroxy-6-naphtoate synthase n=1 Tax=Deinococcus metalli TaxID=1141878 RepID=A0A7W8KKE3_9DEIO|nr:1,4-dihydroxy-6-naphthoate synthase [Deinococcus metalli]MBB5378164.1 1,4-dihydroxy-6-naphthoate synthase [Deinococcus metalli]GHF56511.1 1,4-dihydroxy-6-naphtoate synthase [Deinococcus metalli]
MTSSTLPDTLDLGYSLCPNDTFIFHALHAGLVRGPLPVREVLEDVQTLNEWAVQGRLPMTKISYRAYFEVMEDYVALRAGGALGRGVGPLIVTRGDVQDLNGKVVASPGALTTAELLLRLVFPDVQVVRMRYDEVMPAVQRGESGGQAVAAGLIIHESRFTYQNFGLSKRLDLGAWWEQDTGLPLPLGAILVRRDLPVDLQRELNAAVRASLEYAYAHPDASRAYVREHALELSDEVMQAHIDLYVNGFSVDVGEEGEQAVRELHRRAVAVGAVRDSGLPLFVER